MSQPNNPITQDSETGILTCFVQQISEDNTEMTENNTRYVERWKGPTSECKTITSTGFSVYGTKFLPGSQRPNIESNTHFCQYVAPPTLPSSSYKWIVNNIRCSHCDSGDHTLIEITYLNVNEEGGGGGGSEGGLVVSWSINWASKSPSVLYYLKGGEKGTGNPVRHTVPDAKLDLVNNPPPTTEIEVVKAVKCYSNRTSHSDKYTLNDWEFAKGVNIYQLLEGDIRSVADFYDRGVNPNLHYPILTKTTTSMTGVADGLQSDLTTERERQEGDVEGTEVTKNKQNHTEKHTTTTFFTDGEGNEMTRINEKTYSVIGGGIDRIGVPTGNPYKFEVDYKWLKVADDVQSNSNGVGYQRKEQWWGDLSWEEKFYGNNAWTPGSIPSN